MKTETTEEAMALLKAMRAEHIENARKVADELIARYGKTNTKVVFDVMDGRGLIDRSIREHWLAAVFRTGKYKWTGELTLGRGHEGRGAKVWAFA